MENHLEAACHSAGQGIHRILQHSKFQFYIHKSPLPDHILKNINPSQHTKIHKRGTSWGHIRSVTSGSRHCNEYNVLRPSVFS